MSRMVSLMEGTEVMMAGVGCGVPAVGSAPLSLFAGAGGPFLALFAPFSGSGGAIKCSHPSLLVRGDGVVVCVLPSMFGDFGGPPCRGVECGVVCWSFLTRSAVVIEAGRG